MGNAIQTAWVERPRRTTGLDHLGVRAPCINIYGQLLPGITNVTDRARYFSFYTWVIWKLDQEGVRDWDEVAKDIIRKADCLNTLIAEYHRVLSEDDRAHSAAAVGILALGGKAREISPNKLITLSNHAQLETSPDRYFKNPYGGLGQYYIGSLRDMLILAGDTNSGLRYSDGRGTVLAQAFDSGVDGDRFWNCIRSDSVTEEDLEALVGFCPCGIPENVQEQKVLSAILFAEDEHANEADKIRRLSLQLMLSLAAQAESAGLAFTPQLFRGAVYGTSLQGKPWELPASLNAVRERWAVYSQNEVLAMALQGMFYALLCHISGIKRPSEHDTPQSLSRWVVDSDVGMQVLGQFQADTWEELLEQTKATLPELEDWHEDSHEIKLMDDIEKLGQQPITDDVVVKLIVAGINAIAALAVRHGGEGSRYKGLSFSSGYFDFFPLNLDALHNKMTSWKTLTLSNWLQWVLTHWCTEAHLRVALRKLRGQSEDTFQIRPTEQGLIIVNEPTPEHTNPRFRQARQVLVDIGALNFVAGERYQMTKMGYSLLEVQDD